MTQAQGSMAAQETEHRVFRRGGISYLRIPAAEPPKAAAFYQRVFGWNIDMERADPNFEDGTGHVIGHFVPDAEVVGEAGVRPYVYVDDVDAALARVVASGGEVERRLYPEGDLWVAAVRDPAGNVVGIWQHGPRR